MCTYDRFSAHVFVTSVAACVCMHVRMCVRICVCMYTYQLSHAFVPTVATCVYVVCMYVCMYTYNLFVHIFVVADACEDLYMCIHNVCVLY